MEQMGDEMTDWGVKLATDFAFKRGFYEAGMTLFTGHTRPPLEVEEFAPDNIPGPKKERIVFQPSFSRGDVKLQVRNEIGWFFHTHQGRVWVFQNLKLDE